MAAGSTYTPIATYTVPSVQSSFSFTSIPGTYTDLVAIVNGTTTTSAQAIKVRFNNDTTSLYSRTAVFGDGSSAGSTRDSSVTSIDMLYYGTTQATGICNVMNYSNSTTFKTTISRGNDPASALNAIVSMYRATPPITTMTFFLASGNFSVGSTFTLYGIAAA